MRSQILAEYISFYMRYCLLSLNENWSIQRLVSLTGHFWTHPASLTDQAKEPASFRVLQSRLLHTFLLFFHLVFSHVVDIAVRGSSGCTTQLLNYPTIFYRETFSTQNRKMEGILQNCLLMTSFFAIFLAIITNIPQGKYLIYRS